MSGSFQAYEVSEGEDGKFSGRVVDREVDQLPAGEVLVQVQYSCLNYKDALSSAGNRGVTRNFPHTPGIDAAGIVKTSEIGRFSPGQQVIVSGYDLGMNTAGAFAELIRTPADWVLPLPDGLSARESMIIGTAGFTAAQCVEKLIHNGLEAGAGSVLVTGASGGVGIMAVALLAKLGFSVTASTGKEASHELLKTLGAAEVIDRNVLSEPNPRPMLKQQWAGAVDVVGGVTLSNVIKSLRYGGSVACCGLVESPEFPATVFPFILRAANLLGIDSAEAPPEKKIALWQRLATDWKPGALEDIATEITLDQLSESLDNVLCGQALGRFLLRL
ncbi:MAG: YhdH/YhfP family quinone oxidoreductase [Gammaproteobacteria bacterium]|nr:YhdH/YhfP family quinone oxidoreductase [Gammaproteobacteria bacterium]